MKFETFIRAVGLAMDRDRKGLDALLACEIALANKSRKFDVARRLESLREKMDETEFQ